MKYFFSTLISLFAITAIYAQKPSQLLDELPVYSPGSSQIDWLLNNTTYKAGVFASADRKELVLSNGLVERVLRIDPDVACVSYKNLTAGLEMLRAINPEAVVTIDMIEYPIGSLKGQKERGYLKKEWVDNYSSFDREFQLNDIRISGITSYLDWKPARWCSNPSLPTGKTVSFFYNAVKNPRLKDMTIIVNYEIYDGIPLMNKWVEIVNEGDQSFVINRVVSESLALVEEESAVVGTPEEMLKPHYLHVETNYAFNNAMNYRVSDQTTHWKRDYNYTSQVNYNYDTPCVLEIYPKTDSNERLNVGNRFRSPHSFQLLFDGYDRERNGLAVRKMYRTVAPWVTENPIFMHLVSRTDEQVFTAIDQCAETGYEALILSFGSHIKIEDTSDENVKRMKTFAGYAHGKGIQIGCYSLFSSRSIGPETDVIDPLTGKPGGAFFGNAPCLASEWGLEYIQKLKYMYTQTGFDIFENDGPYPGDVCASTSHPGHEGLHDSQWKQMELQKEFYRWCNQQGIYVNAPDWYFLDGTNKIGLGYREVNFSLPRDRQKVLNRQNIYDGTWWKTPSMGWGFVPLTAYQGGGADAVLEPLSEHLKDYEQLMVQYYGAGVQACYRGPRLYDTEETKKVVQDVISWYKRYRDILNSDIIHLRRADGRDWDGIMHVNPDLKEKAFIMVYNPLNEPIEKEISIPLYYTSLTDSATVKEKAEKGTKQKLDRDYSITLKISIPADGYNWYVVE
ncbi:MAG: hypothetical protein VB074_14730 [Proteiniphilum sp.]|uniref:hypothetical protein n=1 Tax=Proteiniphilum sp. TaxID=1926877 RepID=UPI002B1FD130|nr:hypothetical protein [Proteiniphilum sp.]MEA5129432.1 hypothetical protein [Proteiniphilum sp.]